ncbi:MFS transporter [Helicobacter himalayensis]|uniref:MFS transporter n=1 Tax=Helicobacter himalayensis TaxID=1591088 RepID=UPI003D6F915F
MFKDIFGLTLVSSLRFFGLFIALPAISLYTSSFETSAFLAGIAAGGYAITQIIFQTPFGIWSDKVDRKIVLIFGLVIFIIGSFVCAFADSITMLIIGRFIQGAGAIGGVISAQIADLVREESRTKAMAIMGAGIFISFILAMILGPIVAAYLGLNAIFFLTAGLNLIALLVLIFKVESSPVMQYSYQDSQIETLLKNKNLQIMNLSSFLQKFLMILSFVVVGMALKNHFALYEFDLWKIYAPAAILGLLMLAPATILAQKKGYFKQVLLFGIGAFGVAYLLIGIAGAMESLWLFVVGVFLFFIGFSVHEPIMQALTSRYAKAAQKGSALGLFTTLGFVGSALGAVCGGLFYELFDISLLACGVVIVCVLWAIVMALRLQNPTHEKNLYLPLDSFNLEHFTRLNVRSGIIEWYVNSTQGVIVVKYEESKISKEEILESVA